MIALKEKERRGDARMKVKAMTMFATLLIALSMVGVAYAHWSDSVQIEGTVNMGELIVGILDIKDCWDNEGENTPIKEVASVECSLSVPETSVHHDPPQTVYKVMTVVVTNAYPNYEAWCKFDLKNAGTIPAHIISVTVTDPVGNSALDWVHLPDCTWEGRDPVTGKPVINLRIYKQETGDPLECNQIDPCTEIPVDLWLEIKQDALECHTYDFKITIEAIQWNKYVP